MKKTYVKPMVAFESFQMTSNVAGDCANLPNSQTTETCNITVSEYTIFADPNKDCVFTPQDDIMAFICYHVPTGDASIFTS